MNRRLVSRLKRINFISGPHFFYLRLGNRIGGQLLRRLGQWRGGVSIGEGYPGKSEDSD